MAVENQVAILYAAINGYLDDVPVDKLRDFEERFHKYLQTARKDVLESINKERELTGEVEKKLKGAIEEFKKL